MISTVIRTAFIYIFVTFAIRVMGKRQIGDMQPNELVITLLISEIAAIPLQDSNQPVLNGVAAIFVLVVFEVIISYLVLKFPIFRKGMNGKPIVIINNGNIDIDAMKRVRMTTVDLTELLRTNGVFNPSDVAFAVLEVNGTLSVMPKKIVSPPSAKDLSVKPQNDLIYLPVISDGNIVKENLQYYNIEENAVTKHLEKLNLKADKIFLMTADQNGNFQIVKKKE